MEKPELLKNIFKASKVRNTDKYFDQYLEKSEVYLNKLLTVIKQWQ